MVDGASLSAGEVHDHVEQLFREEGLLSAPGDQGLTTGDVIRQGGREIRPVMKERESEKQTRMRDSPSV